MKQQADVWSLISSEALQLLEMPDMLLSEILTALRLEFCTFVCNEFSLLKKCNVVVHQAFQTKNFL